jgi:small subunit ribosomal protein S20
VNRLPQIKSAKKRVEVAEKYNQQNRANKSLMKTAIKKLDDAITAKGDNTQEVFRSTVSTIDKVASKGAIHKKAANRKKAQMARAMQNA